MYNRELIKFDYVHVCYIENRPYNSFLWNDMMLLDEEGMYLGGASWVMDGTGEEKLPSSIDNEWPAIISHSLLLPAFVLVTVRSRHLLLVFMGAGGSNDQWKSDGNQKNFENRHVNWDNCMCNNGEKEKEVKCGLIQVTLLLRCKSC